jgi:hypothetical protein
MPRRDHRQRRQIGTRDCDGGVTVVTTIMIWVVAGVMTDYIAVCASVVTGTVM